MSSENQHPSEPPALTEADVRAEVTAQRSELAAILACLSPDDWDAATLCSGWRVRELVAHVTMPFRYSVAEFLGQLARSGGNFNRMSDRCARRDAAALSPAELTAALADNVAHPWKPPGGGIAGALSHDLIHGLDLTVPLGIDWRVPEARLRIVLAELSPRRLKYFGVDLNGVELRADDLEWSYGSGVALHGAAKDLLMVVCGRTLPASHLHGAAAARFSSTERDSA
jgi:uncharacterized protein (TIGR03083 family)